MPEGALIERCAPGISPALMRELVRAESSWRPYAIGLDTKEGLSVRQPVSLAEAVATAEALASAGRRFSVGLAQIHIGNVHRYRLSWAQAFDPCRNLALGQSLLWDFHRQATAAGYVGVAAVRAALRGYNSGGIERSVSNAYADRIVAATRSAPSPPVRIDTGTARTSGVLESSPTGAREIFDKRAARGL
jgi:type IV secretion system protein VirB1